MKHYLPTNKLYILSGPSASGKTTMIKNLTGSIGAEAIISSDDLRRKILGVNKDIDEYGIKHHINGWTYNNPEIFDILYKMVELRLSQGLPTIIDATNLDDNVRKDYVKIADHYGVESEILIIDTDINICKERMSKRLERFSPHGIDSQFKRFQKTSRFNHRVLTNHDQIVFIPPLLETKKIDVVGDVHGLLQEMIALLDQAGWKYQNNTFTHSDPERKLLFVGDVVDRGPQSIEVLNLAMELVKQKKAFFIIGNHEANILKAFLYKEKNQVMGRASVSSNETIAKILALPEEKQKEIINFLRTRPHFLVYWEDKNGNLTQQEHETYKKAAFVHADIKYFNPYTILKEEVVYGNSKLHSPQDTDKNYSAGFGQINDYLLVRGHIPSTNPQKQDYPYVISLDNKQAFSGEMCLLPFDKLIDQYDPGNYSIPHIVKQKCDFNYDYYLNKEKKLLTDLKKLSDQKLVTFKANEDNTLFIYKYSRKVFFDNLWSKSKALFKARGLVLDLGGNIIQHPFDKIFNYQENNAGKNLPLNEKIIAVEKVNGFLGCITKHPYKNDLLLTTTGSFDSDFVGYIKDFITPEIKAKLLEFFADNNLTLMFEVVHPQDPHIIEYSAAEHGLYLIGARGKNESENVFTEDKLDQLAEKLNFKRPKWSLMEFAEVLNKLRQEKIEGYMVRKNSLLQETVLKAKTNYYLVTKFIGRMNAGNIKLMYHNSKKFKEKVEEEFYPLIDYLTKNYTLEFFSNMTNEDKIKTVRQSIELLNTENNNNNNFNKIQP